MPTATSGASRRGEEPPDQRQSGLCSMQRPVILLSGLPPDLPDGFIRRAYRPSDRSSLPPTLPTGFVSQTFRPPDRQTFPNARPNARPAASPASLTSSPTGSLTASLTSQPHQPAQPTSPTDQPDQPDQPSTPAKVAPPPLSGRLRSAGRRLRGWRSSRHG